ncbi:MAG: class I SAM-dependent methyltransferase [Ekhidna sp.]
MSERFWNKLSKSYDKKAKDKAYHSNISKTKKYLKQHHIVLDFACATGLYSFPFASQVKEIQAFDTSPRMIQVAKSASLERKIENITFSQTTLFDKKYKESSFQAVLAFNILLYFKKPEIVLKRIESLLEKDGLLITTTACLKEKRTLAGLLSGFIISILKTLKVLPYLKFLSMQELEQEIESCGFKIIETDVLMDTPATEYYIVAKKIRG